MPARKPARRKSGGRRGGGAGAAGIKEGVLTVLAIIVALGIAFGVLRANNVTDMDSMISFLRGGGGQISNKFSNIKYNDLVCNVLEDENCLFSKTSRAKIGDLNKDGKTDDNDIYEYRKEHGLLPQAESTPAAPGTAIDQSASTTAPTQNTQEYDAGLNSLKVAEPSNAKYSRSDYPHWTTVSGSCDTRETVLKNVGFNSDPKTCKALTGNSYTDPYTGKTYDDPSKLDIDHIIPLGYVNQHGGAAWSKEKKQQYANDISTVLLPVDASANRQKGDKGPSKWMPTNQSYHCTYAKEWVSIAQKYGISITQNDKTRLQAALNTCG